jgi:hypothetical protein
MTGTLTKTTKRREPTIAWRYDEPIEDNWRCIEL